MDSEGEREKGGGPVRITRIACVLGGGARAGGGVCVERERCGGKGRRLKLQRWKIIELPDGWVQGARVGCGAGMLPAGGHLLATWATWGKAILEPPLSMKNQPVEAAVCKHEITVTSTVEITES